MLPRGPTSEAGTQQSGARSLYPAGGYPGSPTSEADTERHEDAGPVPFLQRSTSGRLPPAYRSWDTDEPGEPVPGSELGSSNASSSVGGRLTLVSSESGEQPLRPQYRGDVKSPLGPS